MKAKGTIFAVVYRRLVPRLGHAQAIGAIAHRLCRLIWSIWSWPFTSTQHPRRKRHRRFWRRAPSHRHDPDSNQSTNNIVIVDTNGRQVSRGRWRVLILPAAISIAITKIARDDP